MQMIRGISPLDASNSGRRVKHVSRSCQECRRRKVKCNGLSQCSGCLDRGVQCEYSGEPDKRHTRKLIHTLKTSVILKDARIKQLVDHLIAKGVDIPPDPQSSPEPESPSAKMDDSA